MDCKPDEIACRLDSIAQAIGEPTWTDIATAIVAAFAALGTIVIASMNFRLIVRQHKLEQEDRLRVRLASRTAYGSVVRRMAVDALFGRMRDEDEPPFTPDIDLARKADRLEVETGEPTAGLIRGWAMNRASNDPMVAWDFDALEASLRGIDDGIDKWVADPFEPKHGESYSPEAD